MYTRDELHMCWNHSAFYPDIMEFWISPPAFFTCAIKRFVILPRWRGNFSISGLWTLTLFPEDSRNFFGVLPDIWVKDFDYFGRLCYLRSEGIQKCWKWLVSYCCLGSGWIFGIFRTADVRQCMLRGWPIQGTCALIDFLLLHGTFTPSCIWEACCWVYPWAMPCASLRYWYIAYNLQSAQHW